MLTMDQMGKKRVDHIDESSQNYYSILVLSPAALPFDSLWPLCLVFNPDILKAPINTLQTEHRTAHSYQLAAEHLEAREPDI